MVADKPFTNGVVTIVNDYSWIPQWLVNLGIANARINYSMNNDTYNLRIAYGTEPGQYLQHEIAAKYLEGLSEKQIQDFISTWLKTNGVSVDYKTAEELAGELEVKKKRVRMGKWGVKKEHLHG